VRTASHPLQNVNETLSRIEAHKQVPASLRTELYRPIPRSKSVATSVGIYSGQRAGSARLSGGLFTQSFQERPLFILSGRPLSKSMVNERSNYSHYHKNNDHYTAYFNDSSSFSFFIPVICNFHDCRSYLSTPERHEIDLLRCLNLKSVPLDVER